MAFWEYNAQIGVKTFAHIYFKPQKANYVTYREATICCHQNNWSHINLLFLFNWHHLLPEMVYQGKISDSHRNCNLIFFLTFNIAFSLSSFRCCVPFTHQISACLTIPDIIQTLYRLVTDYACTQSTFRLFRSNPPKSIDFECCLCQCLSFFFIFSI